MANDRENNLQGQPVTGGAENTGSDRIEQFNELSELSLEERMNVADQIGVPVENLGEAAALGTISGRDDAAGSADAGTEEQSTSEELDR